MKKTLFVMMVMGFTVGAAAQQYKWTDKDGRTQYGDVPPPGVKATRIKGPSAAASAPAPAPAAKKGEKSLTPEAAFQKRQQDAREQEDKAAKERAEADARRSNCEAAQASLRQIQSGQRMMTMNAAGERVYLDDDARAREADRAQKAVSEQCK